MGKASEDDTWVNYLSVEGRWQTNDWNHWVNKNGKYHRNAFYLPNGCCSTLPLWLVSVRPRISLWQMFSLAAVASKRVRRFFFDGEKRLVNLKPLSACTHSTCTPRRANHSFLKEISRRIGALFWVRPQWNAGRKTRRWRYIGTGEALGPKYSA